MNFIENKSLEIRYQNLINDRKQFDCNTNPLSFVPSFGKKDNITVMYKLLHNEKDIDKFLELFRQYPYEKNSIWTPLKIAVSYGDLKIIKDILNFYKYNISKIDSDILSYLINVTQCPLIFEELMKITNLEISNDHLIMCSKNNNIDINMFKIICDNTDINYCDLLGNNSLFYCGTLHFNDKLSLLLGYPNVNIHNVNKFGENILIAMINNNNFKGVDIFLNHFKKNEDKEKFRAMLQKPTVETYKIIYDFTCRNDDQVGELLRILNSYNCKLTIFNNTDANPLIGSIKNKSKEIFDLLINDSQIDVNIQDSCGNTPLKVAVMNCMNVNMFNTDEEDLYYFIKLVNHPKININMIPLCSNSILFFLLEEYYKIEKNTQPIIGFNNDNVQNVHIYSAQGEYDYKQDLIMETISTSGKENHKQEKICRLLVECLFMGKVDANILNNSGESVLEKIVDNKDFDLFKLFLSFPQLDINIKNREGKTIFMYILEKMKCITSDEKIYVNTTKKNSKFTPIWNSGKFILDNAPEDLPLACDPYIGNDKSINSDNQIYFPLINALIKHPNFDPNVQDIYGNTGLFYCVHNKENIVLDLLLQLNSTNKDIQNYCGYTALMHAVGSGLWHIVSLLVKNGADITLKNNEGNTVFELVSKEEHKYVLSNITKQNIDDRNNLTNTGNGNITSTKSWFFKN